MALSFGLRYIKIFSMPQGGSLTLLSMLPIMLYAYMFGPREGLVAAAAYSVLQCVQGVFFLNFLQFLFDYIIGFTLLGLAGLFHKSKIRINLNVEKAKKRINKSIQSNKRFSACVGCGYDDRLYRPLFSFRSRGLCILGRLRPAGDSIR